MEVFAKGRADWIGWLELKREPVNDIGVRPNVGPMNTSNTRGLANK